MRLAIHVAIAYAAGLLSFFAPCGTFLLPAFFAYGFKERGRLLSATWMFLGGFAALFIPVGLGVHWISVRLALYRENLVWLGGAAMFLLAAMALVGAGPHLAVPAALTRPRADRTAPWSVFVLGLAFGFTIAGCTAPLLAISLALAGTSANAVAAIAILAAFVIGLGTPLLAIAAAADRAKLLDSRLFRAQSTRITILGHEFWVSPVNIVTALLIMALAVVFVTSRGTFFIDRLLKLPRLLDFNVALAEALSRLR